MNRLASATKFDKWQHRFMQIPRKRLDNEVFNSGQWLATWYIAEQFQVTHTFNTQEFIVDIAKRSCSCNFWELVEILCWHDVAALSYKKQNPDDFVDECYTRVKYALYYGFFTKKVRIWECGEDGARRRIPGDVQPDASQAHNKVDVDNNVVADNNVVENQASSCVADTSQIGLSQVQAKQKRGKSMYEDEKKAE
ncbi:hypothetical protein KIW84_032821 [Lathyrus oleraceus]|uniref:SWIM-type domain-containing protein n=1 Tax=Pisum sativum TaxID=3888 RepID=A0A9D4XZM3_PEA|nr:hypothetical protein KIW84_032821 [Pisum sativum]